MWLLVKYSSLVVSVGKTQREIELNQTLKSSRLDELKLELNSPTLWWVKSNSPTKWINS